MNEDSIEKALQAHADALAALEPAAGQVGRTIARARAGQFGRRARPESMTVALLLSCLVLGAAVAAAAGILPSPLSSFLRGGDPPGKELSGDELPSWLRPKPGYTPPTEVSVVASAGAERLLASRLRGYICFEYGHHVGECKQPRAWRQELRKSSWILRGPIHGRGGTEVWFGLAAAGISTIRVDYRDGGAAVTAVGNGGFVLEVDSRRHPHRIVGLDRAGNEVAARDLEVVARSTSTDR